MSDTEGKTLTVAPEAEMAIDHPQPQPQAQDQPQDQIHQNHDLLDSGLPLPQPQPENQPQSPQHDQHQTMPEGAGGAVAGTQIPPSNPPPAQTPEEQKDSRESHEPKGPEEVEEQNGAKDVNEAKEPKEAEKAKEPEDPNPAVVSDVANDDDLSSLSPVSSGAVDETLDNLHAAEVKVSPVPAASPEVVKAEVEPVPQSGQADTEMVDVHSNPAPVNNEAKREDERPVVVSHYPKRKRTSTYREIEEDYDDNDETIVQVEEQPQGATGMPVKRHGAQGIKGVIVGHWRDSNAPLKPQKHAVIAFIDIRDRLRTRIQPTNMKGEPIDLNLYPIPPGPGGSWTTFGGIVFENQLVGLEQFHIKEFVKIRSDADPNEDPGQKYVADKKAVKEAIRRVAANPPPETPANAQPAIAYGDDIPDSVRELDDQKRKKRRLGSGTASVNQHNAPMSPSTQVVRTPPPERAIQPAPMVHSPVQMAPMPSKPAIEPSLPTTTLNNLPGARPTKVLVGTWSNSSEIRKEDRHAVYGILGINDMFRVKVVRETQAGRFLDGNFPQGAGALWITYDQVELDTHLANLARAEVKEYVRYRQFQIDTGENEKDRDENIRVAITQASRRWAAFEKKAEALKEDGATNQPSHATNGSSPHNFGAQQFPGTPESRNGLRSSIRETRQTISGQPPQPGSHGQMGEVVTPGQQSADHSPSMELSASMKIDGRTKAGRMAKAQAAAAAASRRDVENAVAAGQMGGRPIEPRPATRSRRSSTDAIERTQNLVQREVARAEANAKRDERHEANREMRAATGTPVLAVQGQGLGMDPNIERLDKVWQAQEANRINKYQAEDAIFHAGIKYVRRNTGPFLNKLSSHGAILNIDGEDYVEYRVLLKPAFF